MAYNYSYGDDGTYHVPDTNLTYINLDKVGAQSQGGGGMQYRKAGFGMDSPFVKDLFGGGGMGGGTGAPQYGAGGGLGSTGAAIGGGGPAGAYTGAINRGRSSGGIGGSIPTLTSRGAAQTRAALASAPYQYQAAAQQQALDGQMSIAQMNAKAALAAQMLQLEAEREARLQMQIDNERNRMHAAEQQRRGALQDQYGQQLQYRYQYGLGPQ